MSTITKADVLRYSHTIGLCAMEGRGFYCPVDTGIGKDGRLYVVNRSVENYFDGVRLVIIDLDGGYFGTFGSYGEGDGQFVWPSCTAADSEGRIYVSDEHTGRITVFDASGGFLTTWGMLGDREGELDGTSGIAFDKHDDVYVSDTHNNRIQKYTKDGRFLLTFGSKGNGDGQFNLPWGLTVASNGDVCVADWGNDRIQRFSPDGRFIAKYGVSGRGDGQFSRPSGVAVDRNGCMYVADWGNERLQVLDSEGNFVLQNRGESTLSSWAEDYLSSNTEEADARLRADLEPEIEFFVDDPHEESSHIEKYFWSPVSIKLDESGRLYITEGNRHRIQVFQTGS